VGGLQTEGVFNVVHGTSVKSASRGGEKASLFRRSIGLVACAAGAVACCALIGGGQGGSGRSELRALDTANLPSYTAAALALRSSVKDTENLVNMQAKAHGDHALGNKALLKIEAAARKAALASNSKLREADDALAESQKALGTNAVHLHLLTGASTGRGADSGPMSSAQLAALIEHSRTDADAKKALAEAKAAAAKNKKLMQGAKDAISTASKVLGKDAVSIPTLGSPPGGPHHHGSGAEHRVQGKGQSPGEAKHAIEQAREEFLANRRFLHATRGAFDRP